MLALACLAVASGIPALAESAPPRLRSPRGRFEVVFRELERRRFTAEEQLQALEHVDHVRYEIRFTRVGAERPAAVVGYVDVYGFDDPPRPHSPQQLFDWLSWSPEDDFVVLPAEGWASAPGTPERTAVALDEALEWKVSPMRLDRPIWIDRYRVVGERHDDCDYSVDLFDGRTGAQAAIYREPTSPLGYEMIERVGRTLRIRSVLDNCAGEDDRRTYVPSCYDIDLDSRHIVASRCDRGADGAR